MWVWELRDVRTLPKHLQPLGKDAKKRWQQAQTRLAALSNVIACVNQGGTTAKAQQKLAKAVEKLHKAPVMEALAPAPVGTPAAVLLGASTPDDGTVQRAKRKYAHD